MGRSILKAPQISNFQFPVSSFQFQISNYQTNMSEFIKFISTHIDMVYVLILSIFVGVEVIGKVPSVLHTPLMSGANAIHGVIIIGAIIVMLNVDPEDTAAIILGFIAVILGTLNVVGGFVVTDRMLEMFKKKAKN
jgi:NAD(P) transhydrogenase subunit alpha